MDVIISAGVNALDDGEKYMKGVRLGKTCTQSWPMHIVQEWHYLRHRSISIK